jgi:hypothetical protein
METTKPVKSNPLKFAAYIAGLSIVINGLEVLKSHSSDPMVLMRLFTAILFLPFFIKKSDKAWHVFYWPLTLFFPTYVLLQLLGYYSAPKYNSTTSIMIGTYFIAMVYLYRFKQRYAIYLSTQTSESPN